MKLKGSRYRTPTRPKQETEMNDQDLSHLSRIIQHTVTQESYENSYLKILQKKANYHCSFYGPKHVDPRAAEKDPLFVELDIDTSDISSDYNQDHQVDKNKKLTLGEKIMRGMKKRRVELIDQLRTMKDKDEREKSDQGRQLKDLLNNLRSMRKKQNKP